MFVKEIILKTTKTCSFINVLVMMSECKYDNLEKITIHFYEANRFHNPRFDKLSMQFNAILLRFEQNLKIVLITRIIGIRNVQILTKEKSIMATCLGKKLYDCNVTKLFTPSQIRYSNVYFCSNCEIKMANIPGEYVFE